MAGIGFASVDTDVSSLVNAAFEELECCGSTWGTGCSGGQMGFFDAHGCLSGMICHEHFKWWMDSFVPQMASALAVCRSLECQHCKQLFSSVDSVFKVYPL